MNKKFTHVIQAIHIKKDNECNMNEYNLCKNYKFYLAIKNSCNSQIK
jgi:hypothetical protein